jgi:hypothetical protein
MVLRGANRGLRLCQPRFYSTLAARAVIVPRCARLGIQCCHPQRRRPMPRSPHQRSGSRAPKPDRRRATAAKPRPWHVSLMRARAHFLGIVYAVDEKSAEAAAIAEFKIGEDMRRRLIVRSNDD